MVLEHGGPFLYHMLLKTQAGRLPLPTVLGESLLPCTKWVALWDHEVPSLSERTGKQNPSLH